MLSHSYDSNGNRLSKQQLGGDTKYIFDALNRLTKVQYPSMTEELFYDKSGNRTRRVADGVEELYRYDPRNRLTQLSRGGVVTPFRYDSAGNLLADDKALYSYDAFNRTTKVETIDGNVQINRYDAEGLRHELEENGRLVQFIFSNSREVVAEQDENKWMLYIRASSLLASSTDHARTYYHYASDEMGSTTHIVDGEGAVQNRYVYDAWGNVTEQTENVPNRFKFNGQQLDHISQQYYLRARFYNPVIARFTQEDTYRGDGLNLYTYCANNPVYYVDPTGNMTGCQKDAYNRLRQQGVGASEAYYAATGNNPLNAAGTQNMVQREQQTLMNEYQRIMDNVYRQRQGTGSPQQVGSWTHSDVRDQMRGIVDRYGIPTIDISSQQFTPRTDSNMMPYLDGVAVEQDFNNGYATGNAALGGSRPDIAIFSGGNNVYIGDIKTGNARLSTRQQNGNVNNINGFMGQNYTYTQSAYRPI